MNQLIFQSLGSGSSGNCYYIGTYKSGILIDAGISARSIRQRLRTIGLDYENIWGIFITHDHADHVRAVGTLCEKFHIPIYCTQHVREGIERNPCVKPKPNNSCRIIEKNKPIQVSDFTITPFSIAHDSTDCVAYRINVLDTNITLATDIGAVNDELARHIQESEILIIEANYDNQMLEQGPYPAYLKQRIKCGTGHLSNEQCGIFLAQNYHKALKKVFLCHLSQTNNRPEMAYTSVSHELSNIDITVGTDIDLEVLPRTDASKLYILK